MREFSRVDGGVSSRAPFFPAQGTSQSTSRRPGILTGSRNLIWISTSCPLEPRVLVEFDGPPMDLAVHRLSHEKSSLVVLGGAWPSLAYVVPVDHTLRPILSFLPETGIGFKQFFNRPFPEIPDGFDLGANGCNNTFTVRRRLAMPCHHDLEQPTQTSFDGDSFTGSAFWRPGRCGGQLNARRKRAENFQPRQSRRKNPGRESDRRIA